MAAEHKHLIVRAEVEKPPIDPPYATYCAVPGNAGLTAAVIIETSHIVLHVWDEGPIGELQFDVYTCSSLNPHDIFQELDQFSPIKIEYKYLNREQGLKEVEL